MHADVMRAHRPESAAISTLDGGPGIVRPSQARAGLDRRIPTGVLGLAVLAGAIRIPWVWRPAFPDEAGYLLVARQWHGSGFGLYGALWVDRPPLLMEFWRLSETLGGVVAARSLACALVAVLVVAAGGCGVLLGGRRGSWASAVTAAALATSPLVGAREVNGELLAAPLLMVACLGALRSLASWRRRLAHVGWALLAGITGASAVLVKQNFIDALVFMIILTAVAGLRQHVPWPAARRHLVLFGAGAALPLAATAWWAAQSGAGLHELWYTMYGFRSEASRVIASHSLTAPRHRLIELTLLAAASGVFLVATTFFWSCRRALLRMAPAPVAVGAMLAFGTMEVLAGGSYWSHYLIGLVAALSLSAALLADALPARAGRTVIAFVAASSLLATIGTTVHTVPNRDKTTQVSAALRHARVPGDTGYVTYGHANVLLASRLQPGYRYLWSLPLRTRDPRLNGLVSKLSGTSAPTWVVQWEPLDSWGIDTGGRLAVALEEYYRPVADVCGAIIYRHLADQRADPPSTACN